MKKFLLMCFSFGFAISVWAQDRVVTGKVTSAEDGSALPGVNVVVKGTTAGTVSDADGGYKISVPSSGGTLVFSFIGMATQEEEIGARSVVDLQLKTDVKQLQEVVVNAIGENVSKDKLGIASATVTGAAAAQSGETGLINGLAGKAAGLSITRNGGDPGSGSFIQLRGQATVTGDLQPLIVIDGMPMYNTSAGMGVGGTQQQSRLNDLNPADVANVEIIKSAAGAALWGSRAANGVIVITTKKGKNTQSKFNASYTGTVSFDNVNKMPDLQRTYGQGLNGRYAQGSSASYGDLISARPGGVDPTSTAGAYVQFPDGSVRSAIGAGTAANPAGGKVSQNTYDHTKDVFQQGHYIEHGITLSSGTDRSQFYASYDNLSQQGVIKSNSDYNKNVARINFSTSLTDKFHIAINSQFSNVRSNRAQQGSNTSGVLLGQLRTSPDFDNSQWIGTAYSASGAATPGKEISYRNPYGANATPGYDNPNWTINKNKSYAVVNRFIGNVELNYDATDWLTLKANSGVDTYTDRRTDFGNAQSIGYLTGSYTEQYLQESQFNTNMFATARKTFSDAFKGSILVGFNYNNRQFNNVGATVTNFIVPDAPPSLSNAPPSNSTPFNSAVTQRTSAGFTQINAEVFDQLFFTLTGRAESSSTFGPQAQSLFYYPSASGAWQFSKMTGTNDFFSFGKLRASYGIVGLAPAPYQNLTSFGNQNYTDAFGGNLAATSYGVGGLAISTQAGNPKIRPERKHEFEAGLDLRFFNDRVFLSATGYYNKTTDAILPTFVAGSTGFNSQVANAGILDNKGIEISAGATWLKLQNGFTWSSNVIWFANRNNVISLAGAQYVFLAGFSDGASVATKGQPLGAIWGTGYQRNSDGSYFMDPNGVGKYGFPTVSATNGVLGSPQQNYRASLGNTFSYKRLSLYVLFETSVGGQMWNGTQGALFNFGTAKATAVATTVSAADAATIQTADGYNITTSPRATHNTDGSYTFRGTIGNFGAGKVALDQYWNQNGGSGFNVNSPFVQNATWTRLREVTLAYSLNSAAFKAATKLQSVSFALTGRNLLLWTPYTGIDPDTNLTGATNGRGIDYFQNPNTRSVLFKLTITY